MDKEILKKLTDAVEYCDERRWCKNDREDPEMCPYLDVCGDGSDTIRVGDILNFLLDLNNHNVGEVAVNFFPTISKMFDIQYGQKFNIYLENGEPFKYNPCTLLANSIWDCTGDILDGRTLINLLDGTYSVGKYRGVSK